MHKGEIALRDKKYIALKAKQDEMICWSEATADAVRAKMESARLSRNYSLTEFSELLGLPAESTYQNIVVRRRGTLSLDLYLRFCYLFGYDLETVSVLPPRQSALDRAIYELAALFSSCTLAGLYELSNSTEKLKSIPPETRRKLALALRNLGRIVDLEDEETLDEDIK